jgi:hypothetical protein
MFAFGYEKSGLGLAFGLVYLGAVLGLALYQL